MNKQSKDTTFGGHFYQLDILRAVAALSVFLYHWYGSIFNQDQLPWNGLWRNWHQVSNQAFLWLYPLSFAWVGVPLFFVISGFCIHSSWTAGKQHATWQFYWRRAWRIAPPYWVIMGYFVWREWPSLSSQEDSLWNILSHVLFLHNLKDNWFFSISPSFWSLALEMQFYVLYPLVLLWRKHWSMEKILGAALFLSIAGRCLLLAISYFERSNGVSGVIYGNTFLFWFDWLLGALISERIANGQRLFCYPMRWLLAFGLFLVLACQFLPTEIFAFPMASVCSAVCVERFLLHPPSLKKWFARGLVLIGICSYSFYLLHQRLINSVIYHWPYKSLSGKFAAGLFVLIITLILSAFSYWLIEKNSIRLGKHLGRKLFPDKKPSSLDAAAEKFVKAAKRSQL
jgi:peptidoglycan/LPS O-acetylase OafA/YrhL